MLVTLQFNSQQTHCPGTYSIRQQTKYKTSRRMGTSSLCVCTFPTNSRDVVTWVTNHGIHTQVVTLVLTGLDMNTAVYYTLD